MILGKMATDVILTITQLGATLTSAAAIISFMLTYAALIRLQKSFLYKVLIASLIFLLIVMMGVTSMTILHWTEHTAYESVGQKFEILWYIFMFLALVLSWFESERLIRFGKYIRPHGR